MCNLYSQKKSQAEVRDLANAMVDRAGNTPSLLAISPNGKAPVVRALPSGERKLLMMRWGFPLPNLPGTKPRSPYLINIRSTHSRYWLPWLRKIEILCLVPVTSFAEPDWRSSKCVWTWFAQHESRPLMFFAGIWREWEGNRGTKVAPDMGKHLVFSFLTTGASADVAPFHPDATPVLLLDQSARDQWMFAPWEMARELQKPPPAGTLRVIAAGKKEDPV
jgi:putative SOS response-associated peptidase YedK